MLDCLIVGSGPAGATTAYHLAKQQYSVLILEKAKLPRTKPCGGGVSPAIAQWLDFDFSPVIEQKISKVQYTWKLGDPVQSELKMVEPMWMVRRDRFDYFLVEQAQKQGAQLQTETEVSAIAFKGDYWEITTDQGTFQARYLVAADGGCGKVSEWLGLKPSQTSLGATLEITTAIPSDQQETAFFDFGSLKNGYIWAFPKSDGYTISGAIFRGNKAKSEELRKELTNYAQSFGLDVSNALYGDYPIRLWNEQQPLHSNQALVVGEAAGMVDPLSGEGIRPAIFTGFVAASAIAQALAGDANAVPQYTEKVNSEWGVNLGLAQKLAGLFYQFPKIAYKVGVKQPAAASVMSRLLCGELSYSDITDGAIKQLKKSLNPF